MHLAWHKGELGNNLGDEGHKNIHCVQPVYTWNGVMAYASKYLGKTFKVAGWEDGVWTGRYWGVIARANIPFGELRQFDIPLGQAVRLMRYQRRFAKLHIKSNRSQTIFCDASQWLGRVVPGELRANELNQVRLKLIGLIHQIQEDPPGQPPGRKEVS